MQNNNASLVLIDEQGLLTSNPEGIKKLEAISRSFPGLFTVQDKITAYLPVDFVNDLMLIAVVSWRRAIEHNKSWLSKTPSVLVIKP